MTKRITNRIEKEHCYLAGAFFTLVLLVVLYGYLLSATVVHVVMQKEIRGEINNAHSEISKLEAEYIKRQHALSSNIASLQGFVEAPEKIFIDKGETSLVLSDPDTSNN